MAILCRSDKTIQFQRLVKCLHYNPVCGMSSQTFLIKEEIRILEVYCSVNKHTVSYLYLMSSDGTTWKLGS